MIHERDEGAESSRCRSRRSGRVEGSVFKEDARPPNLGSLVDAELDKLKDLGILKNSVVKKAKEAASLAKKVALVHKFISDFIEDGDVEFARLYACIENQRKFEYIIKALVAIKKASKRIGAHHLIKLVSDYEEKYEQDNRRRNTLCLDYQAMKEKFDKIKIDFKTSLMRYAIMADQTTAPPPGTGLSSGPN